jgi:hypothetical protein
VCPVGGLSPVANTAVWFAAQDTAQECQAISDAFGMVDPIQVASWTYACLEDSGINDTVGGGLTGGLFCSTDANCPTAHLTAMDGQDTPCGQAGARRSICPCE